MRDFLFNLNLTYLVLQVSRSIVDQCFKEGINFFDSAESYSKHVSETILGKALEGRRRDAIVATKFGGNIKKKVSCQ